MMQYRCPQCGAPPAQPLPQVGQFSYTCPYCRAHSVLGTPAPPPPPMYQPSVTPFQQPPVIHMPYDHAAVARTYKWSWIIWLVVVLGVTGGGGAIRCATRNSSILSALVWDGEEPLQCSGVDQITVSNVNATFTAGSAIIATGNCKVRCTDCTISAPTAIEVSGNAEVTMVNGSVRGTNLLGSASGNGRIMVIGNAQASGRLQESGLGKISAPVPRTK